MFCFVQGAITKLIIMPAVIRVTITLLIAWKCAELRLPIAWKCAELWPANAWKCKESRLVWECELRGRLRTAARVRGTRVGSAREVRLKCGSSAWNRSSTHWWVPYLYGTGTLRVKLFGNDFPMKVLYITWPTPTLGYPQNSKHLWPFIVIFFVPISVIFVAYYTVRA